MKKNLLWVMIMAVLTLGFTSCSKDDDDKNDKPNPNNKKMLTGIWVQVNENHDNPDESTISFEFKANGQFEAKNFILNDYAYKDIKTRTGSWELESEDELVMIVDDKTNSVKYKFDSETDILCLSDINGKDPLYFMKIEKKEFDIMMEYFPIIGAWYNNKATEYVFYFSNGICYQIDVDKDGKVTGSMSGEWGVDMDIKGIHEEWANNALSFDFKIEVTESTLIQTEINDGRHYEYERADPVFVYDLIKSSLNK